MQSTITTTPHPPKFVLIKKIKNNTHSKNKKRRQNNEANNKAKQKLQPRNKKKNLSP